ncbi:MAG TPA: FAD:protein FMN transferase [Solirubrobacteraceae bacterium]
MTTSARFPAFGSTALVVASEGDELTEAVAAVQRVADAFDLACSRFRDDSEISALNRAGGRPTRVSALMLEAVQAGLRAAELTDGDVDPTVGAALIALGYDQDFDLGLDGRGALRFASVPGWRAVRIDPAAGTVTLPERVSLDLGATAKALAADHAAAAAHDATGSCVLVSFGGDMATAGAPPDSDWLIRVTDDHRSGVDAPGQTITISSGGLATSSTTVRRWRTGGEIRHHLLDPASGRPAAEVWQTVSVAAASCLDANIASTAAIVRGERALSWLTDAGLPSRLVDADGRVRHLAGWPAAGDDLHAVALAGAVA